MRTTDAIPMTPNTVLPAPNQQHAPSPAVHDRIADQIEQTLPEGPSPKGSANRTAARLLFAFGAAALLGMVVFLFIRGGLAAGAVGIAILALYAFMGSTPWMAGTLRARDRREVEVVIDHETQLHDTLHEVKPGRPA